MTCRALQSLEHTSPVETTALTGGQVKLQAGLTGPGIQNAPVEHWIFLHLLS